MLALFFRAQDVAPRRAHAPPRQTSARRREIKRRRRTAAASALRIDFSRSETLHRCRFALLAVSTSGALHLRRARRPIDSRRPAPRRLFQRRALINQRRVAAAAPFFPARRAPRSIRLKSLAFSIMRALTTTTRLSIKREVYYWRQTCRRGHAFKGPSLKGRPVRDACGCGFIAAGSRECHEPIRPSLRD